MKNIVIRSDWIALLWQHVICRMSVRMVPTATFLDNNDDGCNGIL